MLKKYILLYSYIILTTLHGYAQSTGTTIASFESIKNKILDNHDSAYFEAYQFLERGKSKKSASLLMRGHYLVGYFHLRQRSEEALPFLLKAEKIAESEDSLGFKSEVIATKGFYYKNVAQKRDSADYFLTEALAIAKEHGHAPAIIRASEGLSYLAMDEGHYLKAMEYLLAIRPEIQALPSSARKGNLLNNIGHVYLMLNMNEEAKKYFSQALEIIKKDEARFQWNMLKLNLLEANLNLKNIDKAQQLINELDQSYESMSSGMKTIFLCFKGQLQLYFFEYDKAKDLFEKSQEIEPRLQLESRIGLYQAYLGIGDTLKAHQTIVQAENDIEKYRLSTSVISITKLKKALAESYKIMKKPEKALEYVELYLKDYKQLHNEKVINEFFTRDMKQKFELQEKQAEAERQILANKLKIETQQFYIAGLLGLLCLAATIFLVFRYRQQHRYSALLSRKNQQLEQQKEEITIQAARLNEANTEISAINANLEQLVENRTREILKKNKMLEEYAFINAHKLRAPVARILGLVSLFHISSSDQEKLDLFNKIEHEAKALDDLTIIIQQALDEKSEINRDSFH